VFTFPSEEINNTGLFTVCENFIVVMPVFPMLFHVVFGTVVFGIAAPGKPLKDVYPQISGVEEKE
jgi:hypothetical protein